MSNNTKLIAAAIAVTVVGGLIYSQLPMGGTNSMPGMNMDQSAAATASQSTKGFETAMAGMMKGMMAAPTGKADLDFAQGMVPHHQGAIEMAKVVLQYGKDLEVKILAEGVVKAQEGEIAFLKDWLAKTDQAALSVTPDSVKGNTDAMAGMMKNMMTPYTGDADVDFMKGMIPHHQGAIDMAKVALQFAKDPAMLKLATNVVTEQEGEITFMKSWLTKMGK